MHCGALMRMYDVLQVEELRDITEQQAQTLEEYEAQRQVGGLLVMMHSAFLCQCTEAPSRCKRSCLHRLL